jgi:hypothetical protein
LAVGAADAAHISSHFGTSKNREKQVEAPKLLELCAASADIEAL